MKRKYRLIAATACIGFGICAGCILAVVSSAAPGPIRSPKIGERSSPIADPWQIHVAMRTRNSASMGTDSQVQVLLTQDGSDKLVWHLPKGDTSIYYKRNQEQANANYEFYPFTVDNVAPEKLTNSSIRIGIRGSDEWWPRDIFVWSSSPGSPPGSSSEDFRPIAYGHSILSHLSTDKNEGKLTIPLRQVVLGEADMTIKRLLLVVKTAGSSDAETDSPVKIEVSTASGIQASYTIPNSVQEDLERGWANWYDISDLANYFSRSEVTAVRLSISDDDAWLPEQIFLFGLDDATGRPEKIVALVHLVSPDIGWMSTDPGDGSGGRSARESVLLDLAP